MLGATSSAAATLSLWMRRGAVSARFEALKHRGPTIRCSGRPRRAAAELRRWADGGAATDDVTRSALVSAMYVTVVRTEANVSLTFSRLVIGVTMLLVFPEGRSGGA